MSLVRYGGRMLLTLSIAFLTQFVYKLYVGNKKSVPKKEVNEVIMFSQDQIALRKSKYSRVNITESMHRILYYIDKPQYTLDICMYVFTNNDLANAIVKLNFRGVKVRLVIDAAMAYSSGSHVRRLERHGVAVRWLKSTNIMHHKFCLIDTVAPKESSTCPMVMMGSLNWTNQALNGNWEDVTVTSQKDIVDQYRMEFERLWILFSPIVSK